MRPLLSVIIPFYKVEQYLQPCLASIEAQTLTDWECIVVDDGSPDNGHLIADSFVQRDPRFQLIRSENQGLGPARNLGVSHARGTYVTFVDSDDIVPPRAYSQMTAVLEETGSDFAAGNARRFEGPEGVTQSWAHAGTFSRARQATHINVFPALTRDRMAWNKVYRHDFWRAQGLQFPAIRYEDYPVSMRAHLAADAVDIVADHIYYWRQRGSGDSITQSLFEPDNLKDRAHSAHLTLDVLDESANASVIRLAHQHLIDIDLVVFARALVHGTSSDFAQIEELGTQLAQRLHPQRRSGDPLGDVIHRGFLRKDLALVRAMARWRDGEGLAGLRAELPPVPRPTQARPLLRRAVSRTSFQNPLRPRRLRSALTSMTVTDDRTALVVDVRLRPQLAHRATVGVLLRDSGTEGAVPHRVTPTDTGLRLTLDVGIEDIEQHTSHSGVLELALRLTLGGMSWAGTVDANPALMSGPMLGTNCAYQWTAPRGHGLCVRRLDRVHVASVSTDGDKFVISHPHLRSPRVCVVRPFPTEPARFATDDRQSRISADVLLDDPPDEPVTGVVERKVVVERRPGDAPLLLVGEPAVIVRDNRQVEIARDGWGVLTVRHSWAGMDVEDTAAAVAEVADHDAGGGHVPPELGGSTSTAAEEEVLPED